MSVYIILSLDVMKQTAFPPAGDLFPDAVCPRYYDISRSIEITMKEKLCPFDKSPCIREVCMAFCEETGRCGLVQRQDSEKTAIAEATRKSDSDARKNDDHQRKSRFKAELFD